MKYLLTIVMVLCFTLTKANVVTATLDSTSKKIKETTAFVDTSSTFKTMYSDIKSGLIGLAAGLKVGVEHVYMVMVKQQVVKSIVWILVGIIPLLFLLIFGKSMWKWANKNARDSDGFSAFLAFLFYAATIIPSIVLMYHLDTVVTGFVNPEYGAIKEIIQFVK